MRQNLFATTSEDVPASVEDLVAKERLIVRTCIEESLDGVACFRAAMVVEEGAAPIAGEENIACTLDVLESFEGRGDEAHALGFAERMIKEGEGR